MHTFSSANVPIQASSISDIYRLGKFRHNQTRPRPILIKFLRVFDAEAVLSKWSSFRAPIVIKQDLTKEERLIESILLHERWNLVQNGTDRKFIKIRNTQIFVHNKLHGSVQGSKFQAFQHTNTNSSTFSQLEDQPPMEQDASANWLDNNHTSSTPPLKIISLNCRSNQLSALIVEHNADVIIGCESHLDSSISSSEIVPPKFIEKIEVLEEVESLLGYVNV